MLHKLGRRMPALLTLALVLGLAPLAYADIPPGDPPKQDSEEKADTKDKEKPDAGKKGGDCSVNDTFELTGLAALALLFAGASLRRRRA